MARRGGLGKGLGALIPGDHRDGDVGEAELREVPLDAIRPNRFQPRSHFDEESLTELAASIAEVGVLQPVLVRALDDDHGSFELIAGERRWRAARRAGLDVVPAIVQGDASDAHSLEIALIENLHRTDLNALEEAAAYQQLIDEFGLTHEQVAEAVSKARTTVTNSLRLLQLPAPVQGMIAEGQLTAGHARALLALEDRSLIEPTATKVVADGLSVRATEELVKKIASGASPAVAPAAPPEDPAVPDAGIAELEHLLERHLDTRVRVDIKGRRGRVIVEFADLDDLERVYRVITGASHSL